MYSRKKIALTGLMCEESQGDILLVECAKFLLKKQSPFDIEFVEVDFYGRDAIETPQKIITHTSNCNYLKNRIYKRQYRSFLSSLGTTVFMKQYFDKKWEDVELIVFFGVARLNTMLGLILVNIIAEY